MAQGLRLLNPQKHDPRFLNVMAADSNVLNLGTQDSKCPYHVLQGLKFWDLEVLNVAP